MRSLLDNPATLEHVDEVRLSDRAQPVRHQHYRPARQGSFQALLDGALRSPMTVSYRSGRLAMNASNPAARAAATTSSGVTPGRPKAMFSHSVPVKINGS
jgi:hypothetical protein